TPRCRRTRTASAQASAKKRSARHVANSATRGAAPAWKAEGALMGSEVGPSVLRVSFRRAPLGRPVERLERLGGGRASRKSHGERGTGVGARIDVDGAAVRFHDRAGDEEPEAQRAVLGSPPSGLPERLEEG